MSTFFRKRKQLFAVLLGIGLTGPLLTWAQESAPDPQPSVAHRARAARHPPRLTANEALDERVRRLAKSLDLDETQQARLKELLEDERRDIWKVWTENPQPEADRTGPTMAILDGTRDRIRAMLNEQQKKKYPAAVPRDTTGPAHADPEYWLRLTRQQPKPDAEQEQ
jgi:hypothetical protein